MEILTVLDDYIVLIKLSGYDNLYKIETNHSSYSNKNKVYIRNFQIYDYNNNKTDIYIINFNYDDTLNHYTCSLFYSYNYQITQIDLQNNLYKLEYSNTTNDNTFHVIDYQLLYQLLIKLIWDYKI